MTGRQTRGGAYGYAQHLVWRGRVARVGMLATVASVVAVTLALVALGWAGANVAGANAAGVAVGVLVVGCLASCVVLWRTETRAARELQAQIDTFLANDRAHRSPTHEHRDGGGAVATPSNDTNRAWHGHVT